MTATETKQARYINPWYRPESAYSERVYSTSVRPVEYRGLLIYHRFGECHDIVKDRVCIGSYAGLNGAKKAVDTYLDNPSDDFWVSQMDSFLSDGLKRLSELDKTA